MPYTYTIDSDRDVVLVRAEGEITDEELISLSRKISSDPHYHSDCRFFYDYSQVTPDELSSMALWHKAIIIKFPSNPRRAILAGSAADAGVFRMYETRCKLANIEAPRVFLNRKKALDYLNEGVPPEKVIQ